MRTDHLLSMESARKLSVDTAEIRAGGMVALVPSDEDIERLVVPGGEPARIIHTTLYFLGGGLDEGSQEIVLSMVAALAPGLGVVESDAWASCLFNPNGPEPCATYLVGGTQLDLLHETVASEVSSLSLETPAQHSPWVPHITIGYGMEPARLVAHGPVTFDKLRVAFGDENVTDFNLGNPSSSS